MRGQNTKLKRIRRYDPMKYVLPSLVGAGIVIVKPDVV